MIDVLANAQAWCGWEMTTSRLELDEKMLAKAEKDTFADVFRCASLLAPGKFALRCLHSRIEAHYFQNGGFLREGQLLEKAEIDKMRNIPAVIVQGACREPV